MSASSRSGASGEGRTLPIETALNLLAGLCGGLCFVMVQDAVGWGPALVFLLALLGVLAAEAMELPRPPEILSLAAAAALLVPVLSQISRRYAAEPFLEAILILFILRLFERKTPREYVQIALLSLGAVLVYALLSVEKVFLFVCLGTGYCASLTLMLSAWMSREPGVRLSLAELRSLFSRALGMFALMLPLCLLIFFLAPRVGRPAIGPQGGARAARTGFSERLRLGEVGAIQESDRLAFRAEMEEVPLESLYWRGVVLSYFTGSGWEVDLRARDGGRDRPGGSAPRVRQTILLEPGGHRWLFALDRPLSMRGSGALSMGNGIFWRPAGGEGARYEAVSVLAPGPDSLAVPVEAVYLELPRDYSPALRRLTEELTAGIPDGRGRMNAIEAHFKRGDYLWSLGNLARGQDSLERFVLDVRQGNCEYFASAAGVMLRMANVPSRLVGGYRGGHYNRSGGYYSVQDQQAHVWVEAWDRDAERWLRLDPTPAGEAGEKAALDSFGWWGLTDLWEFFDYQWSRRVVSYSARTQSEWALALRDLLRNPRASLRGVSGNLSAWGRAGAGLVALLAALSSLKFFRTRRSRDPCRALLERFDRLMRKRGFLRRSSEGLEEFVSCLDEPLRNVAEPFVRDFEEVWYGGSPLDRGRYERLRRRLREIQKMR